MSTDKEMNVTEQLEAMINGTHEDVIDDTDVENNSVDEEISEESEVKENTEEEAKTDEIEDSENNAEDTELDTETEEEEETKEENDDSTKETSETEEEDQDEDSQAENEESEKDLGNTEEELNKSDKDSEDDKYMYNGVNVKEFYEKVALAKFTANGKEVEAFKDPEDLIRAQQMLHGYSDKMKVLKENKKFLKPLMERGVTEDPDKFNLAMNLLDGDVEAVKKVLKDKNIDPMELDLEELNYTPKNVLPSDAQLLIEETYEQAENLGVGDKFNKVITKEWDVQSLQEMVKNPSVRNDLMEHLSNGTYDIVQDEINRMELLDTTGSLDNVSTVDKYRMAIGRLQKNSYQGNDNIDTTSIPNKEPVKKETPPVETAEEKTRKEAEFKRKAEEKAKREAEVAKQRKKAASLTKRKTASKSKPAPKIEELKGKDFEKAFQNMLMS